MLHFILVIQNVSHEESYLESQKSVIMHAKKVNGQNIRLLQLT